MRETGFMKLLLIKGNHTMLKKYSIIFVLCLYINSCSSILLNTTTVIQGNTGCIVFQLSNSLGIGTISINVNKTAVVTILPSVNFAYFSSEYQNRSTYTGNSTEKRLSFCLHLVTFEDKGFYVTNINQTMYSVKLEVFVPVSSVKITSLPNDSNLVTVIENNKTLFQCKTNPVYPSAVIEWYLDGKPVENATTNINENTSLEISTSNLTYTGDRFDDQKMLHCTAGNIVSMPVISSGNKTIDIRYGPKDLIISPSNQSYTVLESDNIGPIECSTKCKPDCDIIWYGPGLSNITTPVLHVMNITRNHSGRYHCIAKNNYGSRPSVVINVVVQYAPSGKPSITQYPASIITAGIITLTCELSGGIPLAILSWDCSGDIINNSSGTLASYSLSLTVIKTDNGKLCNCSASHTATTYTSTAQYKIDVFFAPAEPLIIFQSPIGPLDTGTNVTLTCEVSGGNPVAKLYWNCGSNFTNQTSGSKASYSSHLQVNSRYNGKNCTCSATHPDKSYKPSKQLSLTVYYPPSSPDIKFDSTLPLFEGNTTNAKCVVLDIGNPKFTTMWKWNQTNLDGFKNETIPIGPVTGHDNGNELSCSVHSSYTDKKGLNLQTRTTLVIEFYPIVIVEGSTKTVIEGEKINLKCTIFGNPTPTGKWFKEEKEQSFITDELVLSFIKTEALRSDTGQYQCEAISTSTLYGKLVSSEYLQLIVNYPPDVNIDDISNQDNEEAVYVCDAFGNPHNYSYMGWEQTYNDIVIRDSDLLDLYTTENRRKLKLSALSYDDSGNYTCFVSNGIPDRDGQYRQYGRKKLNVKGSPVLLHTLPPDDTYSAERGGNITISLNFFTFPDIIDALWYKNSSNIPIITDEHSNLTTTIEEKAIETKLHNVHVTVSDYAYQTILKLRNLDEKLEGMYTLAIRNGFRDENITIFVVISSKPDNPSDLNVTMTTSTEIIISWYRGYSGGHTQVFNISVFDNRGLRLTELINDNHTVLVQVFSIQNLEPSTVYVIRVYSLNKVGKSNVIQINATTEATIADQVTDQPVTSALVGGIAGSISALLIVLIVIGFFYLWRRRHNHDGDKEPIKRRTTETDEDEDGLKDNPLYATSEQPLDTELGPMYGVVNKQKQKKQKMNTDESTDKGPVYSQVQTSNAQGKKKEKDKRVKKTERNGNNNMNIEMGSVYENSDKIAKGREENEIYANTESSNVPSQSLNECNTPLKKNKDGLIYADLDLAPSGKRFVIRGIENRNNYAIIDLSKKAEPLPSDDEDEERNETNSTTKTNE